MILFGDLIYTILNSQSKLKLLSEEVLCHQAPIKLIGLFSVFDRKFFNGNSSILSVFSKIQK